MHALAAIWTASLLIIAAAIHAALGQSDGH